MPLTVGAGLIRGVVSGGIYLVSNGVTRHIASPAVMTAFGFDKGTVYDVPEYLLGLIPAGTVITT